VSAKKACPRENNTTRNIEEEIGEINYLQSTKDRDS
jgi:hypothetical protein